MALILIIYLLLLPVLLIIGEGVISLAASEIKIRPGDRVVISVWLSLFLLGNMLLLLAVFFPLSPLNCIFLVSIVITSSLCRYEVRRNLRDLFAQLNSHFTLLILILILLLIICFFSSVPSNNIDTGAYHFQFAKWLSEYGVVKGLGLVLYPAAISTSWLPLTAPFNSGLLENRCHGIVQGILYFIFIFQMLLSLWRVANRKFSRSDIFLLTACLLVWPNSGLIAEMSVNTAAAFALVTAGYLAINFYPDDDNTTDSRQITNRDNLLFVFSLGVSSLKLTALPIILFIFGYFCVRNGPRVKLRKSAVLFAFIFLSAPVIYSTLTSGYPFFVSSLLKLDLPWAFSRQEVQGFSSIMRSYYSCEHSDACGQSFGSSLYSWILDSKECAWFFCINFFMLFTKPPEENSTRKLYWLFGITGITCTIFVIFYGPSLTYSLGWLTLFPAACILKGKNKELPVATLIFLLLAALIYPRISATRYSLYAFILFKLILTIFLFSLFKFRFPKKVYLYTAGRASIAAAVILLVIGKGFDITLAAYPDFKNRLIIPSNIFNTENCIYQKEKLNDFEIWKVNFGQEKNLCECWSQQLPCSGVYGYMEGVRLGNPEEGIKGGFVR